jgi:hypothetical protein
MDITQVMRDVLDVALHELSFVKCEDSSIFDDDDNG